jgi:hypothetical protein
MSKCFFFPLGPLLMFCMTLAAQTSIQPGSTSKVQPLTSEKRAALEEFQRRMRLSYVDPIIGGKVAAALETAKTHLLAIESPRRFTQSFTRLVQNISKDKHLALAYASSSPRANQSPSKLGPSSKHYDVKRIELLSGGLAYLRIDGFTRLPESKTEFECAFQLLSNADALVLDLSKNGGGNPDTVALVGGYLLGPNKEIAKLIDRNGVVLTTIRTPNTPSRFAGPVEVIVSPATFSAGEGLAFILQQQGRAEIIGQRTAGAANPGKFEPITPHFQAFIPETRVLEPTSGTNWERGVSPDVKARLSESKRVAFSRARSAVSSATKD